MARAGGRSRGSRAGDPVRAVQPRAAAFALSRLPGDDLRNTPVGVFRKVARNSYDKIVRDQLDTAKSKLAGDPEQELAALLGAGDTWTIL